MSKQRSSLSLRVFQVGMKHLVNARFPAQEKFTAKQIADREQVYYELLRHRLSDKDFAKAIYAGMESWRFFPAAADILEAARVAQKSGVGGIGRILSMEEAHEAQKRLEAQWVNGTNVMAEIRKRAEKLLPAAMKALPPRRHTFAMLPATDPFQGMSDEEFERRKALAQERASVAIQASGERK